MQIRFEYQTKYGIFKDALNIPDDHSYTDEELEIMKTERVEKWIYNIENAPPIDETFQSEGE
jgi:hypothetical protein